MKDEEVDNVLFALNPDARLCSVCKRWYDEKYQNKTLLTIDYCSICWYRRNTTDSTFIKIISVFGISNTEKLYFNRYTITVIGSRHLHFQLKEKGE